MGIRKSKPSAINNILWTLLFLILGILAFFFAGPVWTVPFLFIVISNIMFIFQKEERKTRRDPPLIDRERDGIMSHEISNLNFTPPSINEFSTFLIDGDNYYGKFFKVAGRYIFISVNDRFDRAIQVKSINKLLDGVELLESGFIRMSNSENIFKKYPVPNLRISTIEFIPGKPFDEFYVVIISDNNDCEYECLLRDFKFYNASEIKN